MIRNQLGRRNLTDIKRIELNLLLKPMLAAQAMQKVIESGKETGGLRGTGRVLQNSAKPSEPPLNTREDIAKAAGQRSHGDRWGDHGNQHTGGKVAVYQNSDKPFRGSIANPAGYRQSGLRGLPAAM